MQVVHCGCVRVCARVRGRDLSSGGIPTGGGPEDGRAGWGLLVANLGGRRDGTQCDLSPAICSSINHDCIYTHPDTHCARCGDKDVAISECVEGAGSNCGWTGGGVPLPETREGLKHALWAATYHCTAAGGV